MLVSSGPALPTNRDITSKAANETREGRKTRRKYKISDDCWLFAGDVAADGAKTAAEAEDERGTIFLSDDCVSARLLVFASTSSCHEEQSVHWLWPSVRKNFQ